MDAAGWMEVGIECGIDLSGQTSARSKVRVCGDWIRVGGVVTGLWRVLNKHIY